MFIDVHVHPDFYEPLCEEEKDVELRRRSLHILKMGIKPMEHIFLQMEEAGLDKYCLLGRDYTVSDGRPAVENREIAALCRTYPGKFIGFGSVDPNVPDFVEQAEYAVEDLGLHGFKLHPGRQHFFPGEQRLEPLYDLCERHNVPILFHSGLSFERDCEVRYSTPLMFEPVAIRHPKLRICLAHFGWPWVRETAMLMLKYSNVYTDTAALYFDSAREFLRQTLTVDIPRTWIDRSLRHQVLFGSNYPRFEQRRMAEALGTLGFRDSTMDLIKGENAIAFLGF